MNKENLTNAERMIMEIVWNSDKELSNGEITKMAYEETQWSRHTVKTYTTSLVNKGYLGVNQISERKMKFYAAIHKEKYLAGETSQHLRTNYNSLSYMIAGLLNNEEITENELDELEQLIKQHKEK